MEEVLNKAYRYSTITELYICNYVNVYVLEFI